VGGIILIIIVVGVIAGDPDSIEDPASEGTGAIENKTFSIGNIIDHEDRILTVNSAERGWTSSNEFDTPSEGFEYVLIDVTLQNKSEDEVSFNPYHFNIKDGAGVIQDTAFGGVDINTLSSGNLAPGGEISGKLLFEVNEANIEDLTLFYEPAFWGERVEIEL